MTKYKIRCYIPETLNQSLLRNTIIEASEMTVKEGAYMFWKGEYGATNKLIASYPVTFTIVEVIEE